MRAQGKAGSGLGLAIVLALAQAMGGTVGADSTPGQGTTIWINLPAAAEEMPSAVSMESCSSDEGALKFR
jgi:signal transduction histidine kinase